MLTINYYNDFFEIGQQKINFSFYELSLPDDDPVYTLKKVMEDLDFSGLLANCSDKVYKEFMLFAIGRNINKYHRFLYAKLKKFEGKLQEKTA